jgi:inhibitor of cysteine peptidase
MSGKSLGSMPLILLGLVVVGLLTAFAASVMLPSRGVTASYGIGDNGKTISMGEGTTIKVILDENPTTGYSWNESVTPGLQVQDSKYVESGSGLMGAGGSHEWTIKATGKGEQQFSAVYKRQWEPLSGSENTFKLTINVA